MAELFEYRVRADCQHDVGDMLHNVWVDMMTLQETDDGYVDVLFTSPLSLDEIKDHLAKIPLAREMARTVDLASNYTGIDK
jgi:hypothetical protein